MNRLARLALFAGLFLAATWPLSAQTEPGTRTLYLVRHGFYDYDPKADDTVGNALNALGREQAVLVAERLANLGVKATSVTSSEYTRARETGDLIAARLELPCGRDGRLNETTPPGLGLRPDQIDADATERLNAAWDRFAAPNATDITHEVLVCHGNVIRWLVCRALGADPQRWTRMEIANCSLTMIQVRPDGTTRVQMFNEVAHLPLAKQTWSGKGPDWPLPAQKRPK